MQYKVVQRPDWGLELDTSFHDDNPGNARGHINFVLYWGHERVQEVHLESEAGPATLKDALEVTCYDHLVLATISVLTGCFSLHARWSQDDH